MPTAPAQESLTVVSMLAAADLSGNQYKFVKETAARTVNVCTAITDIAYGIQQDDTAAAGRAVGVAIDGISKCVANAAIAAGARVAPAATSKAQTAVGTQFPRGLAVTAAAADNDVFECLLIPIGAAI